MNKKKLLALLMALVMTLTLVPVTAFATETTYAARIGETQYTTAQAALDAAKDDDTVTLYTGNHGDLYLRCTDENSASVDLSDWSGNGDVERFRSLKNVTIEGQEGAIVSKLTFETGMKPAGENSQSKNVLGYMDVDNLTIRGITFKPTDTVMTIGNGNDRLDIDGLTFDNCAVIDSEDSSNGSRLLYAVLTHGTSAYSYSNDNVSMNITDGLDNLTIKKCTFTNLYQVAEIRETNGFAFTNNNISGTRKQTLLLTKNANYSVSGTVSITDNTETGRKSERFMRITGSAAQMTVTGNSVSGYQGDTDTFKATDSGADATYTLNNNSWMSQDDMTAYGAGKINIDKWPVKVAEVNGVQYATLEAAFANAQDGDTITLLANCSGNGIKAPQGKFGTNGLTVDFANHTYTVDGETVGSTGTETNGFQLLKDTKLTFQNGTITSAKAKILVQNYSNLTLQGMTLTLNNPNYTGAYTLSNNNGSVVIKDTTINANTAGRFAFDVCRYASYPSVSVEVKGNSVINGDIEVDAGSGNAMNGMHLTLTSGTHTGEIKLTNGGKTALDAGVNASITKASTFTQAAPEGYTWSAAVNGVQTLEKLPPVAQIGNVEYATLQEAFDVGGEVTLLRNVVLSAPAVVKKTVKLDMATYTINNVEDIWAGSNWSLISVQAGGDLTVTGNGTVSAKAGDCYAFDVRDGGKLTTENGTFMGNISAVYVTNEDGIGVSELNVNGGAFSITQLYKTGTDAETHRFTLNCLDKSYNNGTAKITVKGGTFESFDPSNCLAEGANTNFVADGYEAVANQPTEGKWQVGKVTATEPAKAETAATGYDATYSASKTVTSTDGENTTLDTSDTITVNVKGTNKETVNETAAATAPASLNNIKSMQDFVETVTSKTGDATEVNVTVQLAKGAGDTSETGKIVYEVHPEAIITVSNSDESTTVALTNDQITGSFTFKLYVPTDVAAANGKVTVIHKHADGTTKENLGTFTVADDHTITLTGVSSFSEFELTGTDDNSVTVSALGASLRRRVKTNDKSRVVNTSTDFRMTYQWTLPEGVNLDTTEGACYFLWSKDNGATWKKVNITEFNGNTASIVINGIPRAAFDTTIKTKIHLKYTGVSSDSIEVTGYDRSVNYVANELAKLIITDAWGAYGRYLLATGGTYIVYPNGSISYSE